MAKTDKFLRLRSPSWVFIDWANVHGWEKSLKREVDPKKLYRYLKGYPEIEQINFYFGKDRHLKSKQFLEQVKRIGYKLVTKPVKYILVARIEDRQIRRRKCDFDMEACIDTHAALEKGVNSFIFFTGDGDFAPLYKLLRKKGKQVIVVYMYGHLGKEIFRLKRGIYKVSIETLNRNSKIKFLK